MIGVEASFTDELKHHEAVLSYTADFYNSAEIKMVTGAKVVVTDGVDTVPYLESTEKPGHYFTDLAAGKKNTLYRLIIDDCCGERQTYAAALADGKRNSWQQKSFCWRLPAL